MKKLKKLFVKWLLKDQKLGFEVINNNLSNSEIKLEVTTLGNIVFNGIDLPEGMEIVIRKK